MVPWSHGPMVPWPHGPMAPWSHGPMIVASESLPRLTGLAADAGPKGFEWRGIWASIVISENLPRRTGLSADAGTGTEWIPGGGEAGEIRMFNHWATGLLSGLLPQDCVVATQK